MPTTPEELERLRADIRAVTDIASFTWRRYLGNCQTAHDWPAEGDQTMRGPTLWMREQLAQHYAARGGFPAMHTLVQQAIRALNACDVAGDGWHQVFEDFQRILTCRSVACGPPPLLPQRASRAYTFSADTMMETVSCAVRDGPAV